MKNIPTGYIKEQAHCAGRRGPATLQEEKKLLPHPPELGQRTGFLQEQLGHLLPTHSASPSKLSVSDLQSG